MELGGNPHVALHSLSTYKNYKSPSNLIKIEVNKRNKNGFADCEVQTFKKRKKRKRNYMHSLTLSTKIIFLSPTGKDLIPTTKHFFLFLLIFFFYVLKNPDLIDREKCKI